MRSPTNRQLAAAGFAVVALLVVWYVRPVFHGLVLWFWTAPIVWLPALLVVVVGLTVLRLRRRGRPAPGPRPRPATPPQDVRQLVEALLVRGPRTAGGTIVTALALLALVAGSALKDPLTARQLYLDTTYREIPSLPEGGIPRLVPRDVAVQSASSGFNSPTESLTDFRIVDTPQGLTWTALRTPEGIFRIFTKKTQGIVTLDASSSARQDRGVDAEFEYAPHLRVTDSLRWQLLKRRFLVELADPVGTVDGQGRPIILVPYIEYRGFLIRRPRLGGVFVVHADGRIEDLEPEEAARRPEVAGSGRLFPDTLARRLHDAFAYKRGIWNRFFVHEEQTQITDTEANRQPYLIDFGDRGLKWVTVAEPYGRAFSTNAIFLTDATTGETEVWRVDEDTSLSGNRRAIQTVRSVSIPGVVFADDAPQGQRGGGPGAPGGGSFRVVEPRPVFRDGRLLFLLSIIPETANAISKTVVVDAEQNKVVAIFDNDTDPQADEKVERFLETGRLPEGAAPEDDPAGDGEEPEATDPADEDGPAPRGGGDDADLGRRLDDLLERQRDLLDELERLREDVGRRTAGGARAPGD